MEKKALIFDTSSIISLAMNNLLGILPKLKESSGAEFFITPHVRKEAVETPLKIKRFELEALMIQDLLEKGTLEVFSSKHLESKTQEVLQNANSAYSSKGQKIRLIHVGEASCFALAEIMKDYQTALVIDERTSRILAEKPENLRELLEKKLHREVDFSESKTTHFEGFNVIRSAELCLIAFKKGYIQLPAPPEKVVDALLFGVKLNGCSISSEEIEEAKRLFK